MNFFLIILLSMSVIACGQKRRKIINLNNVEPKNINIQHDEFDLDITFIQRPSIKNKITPICRGMDGCLQVCEYFDHSKCKQLSAHKVVAFWLDKISLYSKKAEIEKDLLLIATQPDVADFLKYMDEGNRVLSSLFKLNSKSYCVIGDSNFYVGYFPLPALYVKKPSSKEVTESQAVPVDKISTSTPIEEAEEAVVAEEVDSSGDEASVPVEEAEAVVAEEVDSSSDEASVPVEEAGEAVVAEEVDSSSSDEASSSEEAEGVVEESESSSSSVEVKTESSVQSLASASPVMEVKEDIQALIKGPLSAEDPGIKKIMDGAILEFDYPIFFSFVKKCFGHQARTFSQVTVEIENDSGFEISHKVLSKACSDNKECIRAGYCSMNSELVWSNLPEDIQELGCAYENFVEILP